MQDKTFTGTGLGLLQVVALPIDLIEHKGECLAGSKDLLQGHKVRTGMVMMAPSDEAQRADQSMSTDSQGTGSVAMEYMRVGKVDQSS